jgi:hypothetical protein
LRQLEPGSQTAVGRCRQRDRAAVRLDQLAHDGKTESRAGSGLIGAYALDLGDVRFSDVTPGGLPRGNLGYEVLRGFAVTLDSRDRRVRLER